VARRGEVLESPINGQRAIFRETVQDTGGKLLRLDFLVAPSGGVLVDRQGLCDASNPCRRTNETID
jgi:hypothetical protein